MPPKIIVGNRNNRYKTYMFESEEEEKPRLYMDYGMAKLLIWMFFLTGFFAGAVAIGIAWLLN